MGLMKLRAYEKLFRSGEYYCDCNYFVHFSIAHRTWLYRANLNDLDEKVLFGAGTMLDPYGKPYYRIKRFVICTGPTVKEEHELCFFVFEKDGKEYCVPGHNDITRFYHYAVKLRRTLDLVAVQFERTFFLGLYCEQEKKYYGFFALVAPDTGTQELFIQNYVGILPANALLEVKK